MSEFPNINPENFRVYGKGNLEDLFHPLARYFSVERKNGKRRQSKIIR